MGTELRYTVLVSVVLSLIESGELSFIFFNLSEISQLLELKAVDTCISPLPTKLPGRYFAGHAGRPFFLIHLKKKRTDTRKFHLRFEKCHISCIFGVPNVWKAHVTL